MHNIGSRERAEEILAWVRKSQLRWDIRACARDGEAPEGWDFLGYGSFRSVWLSPERIAYKVNHEPEWDEQSDQECRNLQEAWENEIPEGCRFPLFNRFDIGDEIVVAMEFIRGVELRNYNESDYRDKHALLWVCRLELGLEDLHDENAMVDEDGYLVVVDFGG